jgi:hypothetical protein
LTTQPLAYIDPQLAFELSRIYTHQQELAGLTGGIMQAMYLRPPTENLEAFLRALALYYGDAVSGGTSVAKHGRRRSSTDQSSAQRITRREGALK